MSGICYHCLREGVEGNRCTLCGKPVVAHSTSDFNNILPPGTYLQNGRFIIGEKLGKGGFGVTYAARDLKYNKLIALKEFVPQYMLAGRRNHSLMIMQDKQEAYEKSLRGFFHESDLLQDLKHDNIVKVYFHFQENNTAYYAMDMLEGEDLKSWVQGRLPMDPKVACSMLRPIMDALVYIHNIRYDEKISETKILHRDISPDNIFIRKNPRNPNEISPCLIDFGAAYIAVNDYTMTVPGVKKNGFSPLEQNWDTSKQGPFTDVYAFAATIYYLVTGKVPLPSMDRELQNDKLVPPSRLNPKITPEVEWIIQKGLALSPSERYQDMIQFGTELCKATGVAWPPYWMPQSPRPVPQPQRPIDLRPIEPPRPVPQPQRPIDLRPIESPRPVPQPPQPIEPLPLVDQPQPEGRSPKLIAALLLDALVFLGLPTAAMAVISPLAGLGVGCGLMLAVNTMLCCLPKRGTLFQHILGCPIDVEGDSGIAARLLIYNLLRMLLPFSLVDELLTLVGAISKSTIESAAGIKLLGQDGEAATPQIPQPPIQPLSQPRLVCSSGRMHGYVYPLQQRTAIGRNPQHVNLCVPPEDNAVSGRHCMICCEHGIWLLQDVGSRNGTWLNDKRIEMNQPVRLSSGDVIRIGQEQFTFQTN